MMSFFRRQQEWVLFSGAVIFATIVILFFIWGTRRLLADFDSAFAPSELPEDASDFRSEEAKEILQRRGLL